MIFNDYISMFVAFVCSFLISFTITPIVRVFAYKIGALDIPKDDRRMHKVTMPLLGGLAIFIAFTVSTLVFCEINRAVLGMLLGTLLIVITGIIDDKYNINPFAKLAMQIISALVAWLMGVRIDHINIFGEYIKFGAFSVVVTVLWIVALTNAVNLIDGLDGLSCGVSTISAVSMLLSTFFLPDTSITVIFLTAILAGSCAGFLPFNFNPARIFMGDTGSLFLGYVLSCVSVMGFFKVNAVVSFWVPFLAFALPLTDTGFAFIRRILHGQSPFKADHGHIHHKLIEIGMNQKQSVTTLYAVSAIMGISAVLLAMSKTLQGLGVLVLAVFIFFFNWIFVSKNEVTREETGLINKSSEAMNNENKQA